MTLSRGLRCLRSALRQVPLHLLRARQISLATWHSSVL